MNQQNNFDAPNNFLQEDEIDLTRYWRILMQRKWAILGLAFTLSLVATLVVFAMKPVYSASTTILIESQQAKAVSIEEVYGLNTGAKEYFLTQFEILKSHDIATKVIEQLNLRNHPEFDPDQQSSLLPKFSLSALLPSGPSEQKSDELIEAEIMSAIVTKFVDQLTISPVRNTQLVNVSFESTSPKLAAAVANTMASVYINSHLEAKLDATRQAATWLGERIEGLKDKLDASEQRLQTYRDKEGLVDVSGVKTLNEQELNELTTRFVEVRRERSRAENIYKQVGSLKNKTPEELMSVPAVLQHPLIHKLQEQESAAKSDMANLAKRYGPKHPKMIAANSRLDTTISELKKQAVSVVAGIRKEYEVAQRNEQDIATQLATSKKEVGAINKKEFKLRELEREAQTNRKLYDLFFTRTQETNESSGFQSAHARVVDKALAPVKPVKPKKGLIIIIAFILGGMLGVVIAFLLDALDSTLKSPADVQDRLHQPLLGILPILNDKDGSPITVYKDKPQSMFSEAVKTIRTGMVLSGIDNPHKITIVTSTSPGEGKSTVSLNLTQSLAQMESVLLIDADMRRPTVATSFNLPQGSPGLSNLVAGTSPLERCVYKQDGFDIIPAGVIPSNPLELISSKAFKEILLSLSEQYDRIIIDSAPVQAVSDSLILSTMADSIIYTIRANSTPHRAVSAGIARFTHSNLPLTGLVLNRVDTEQLEKYSYGNGAYYNGYYGVQA
jgi:capsular exopolysaccharide synthesis family protein